MRPYAGKSWRDLFDIYSPSRLDKKQKREKNEEKKTGKICYQQQLYLCWRLTISLSTALFPLYLLLLQYLFLFLLLLPYWWIYPRTNAESYISIPNFEQRPILQLPMRRLLTNTCTERKTADEIRSYNGNTIVLVLHTSWDGREVKNKINKNVFLRWETYSRFSSLLSRRRLLLGRVDRVLGTNSLEVIVACCVSSIYGWLE